GEDDVKLFKYHVRSEKDKHRKRTIVEIRVPGHINFKWNHSNLENGRELGRAAGEQAIKAYNQHAKLKKHPGPHFINENPEEKDKEGWRTLLEKYDECVERAAVKSQGKAAR
ncbi:MAG: patatin-like phospholipase family protein, partial [Tardiphaga sp.]